MARRRGAFGGVVLIVLGAWGALVPVWDDTHDELWLSVVPGAAVVAGGLLLALTRSRALAALGGWLSMAGGAWFVIGTTVREAPVLPEAEQLAYFSGLGLLITAVAALTLGRLLARGTEETSIPRFHRMTPASAPVEATTDLDGDRVKVAADRERDETSRRWFLSHHV